ncbi:putative relaxase [Escherichia coli M056]|uniref:LPD7 domain-containing protein n=1 Tax=Escherichia coli TaxID=562 RepID=UPI000A183080|nr:LPD7 domain-containing protein [Escherichia coli]OSK14530.1 putative relaxase [Escherichia coli M056]
MLIRSHGYNAGVKEYLEEGVKNGRDYSREELDERVILHGDLDLTDIVYHQIPDKGQERYATFVMSFREDEIQHETLLSITEEFRSFLMYAYEDDEYNFYAEAHLPRLKEITDKKTGAVITRKPHIHISIPRKNLLSGREMNPRGMYESNEKYFEAFQEYINQKYGLESPREHIRINPTSAADVLSRYKGDDFLGKNLEFKRRLVTDVIEKNILSRESFYQHVASFGETRVRNKGKDNEYIAVKLPGDKKFTNLKESIFNDDFIVRRQLKKEPLDNRVIQERLSNWPQRAKEIKYVSKATPKFRQLYKFATQSEKLNLLAQRQNDFYEKYRGRYELYPAERQRDNQRSINENFAGRFTGFADGLQGLSGGDVATDRECRKTINTVFLPGDARLHLGQPDSGKRAGLRHDLPTGRRGNSPGKYDADRFTSVPGVPTLATSFRRGGDRLRSGMGRGKSGVVNLPPYARTPYRVAGISDIAKRGQMLFGEQDTGRANAINGVCPIKRLMPKSDTNASFVAAWFLRRMEQEQILPVQRKELIAVDKKFFEARRAVFSDERLSRKDKAQYVSVLTFERLKAHHAITKPDIPFEQESPDMGSADIRKLIKEPRIPDNSISGAQVEDKDIPPARARFSRIIERINEHMSEHRRRNRQRVISTADLYTRRARLSKNVHYLDKKTDRTLFIDTGTSIALRKQGMTDSAVLVALELAKEKFGSTLTIKGSKDFKELVIDVVAKNNLDIHFSDKAMNKELEARREELNIKSEGQRIEPSGPAETEVSSKDSPVDERENHETPDITRLEGKLVDHGVEPGSNSYFVKLKDWDGHETILQGSELQKAVNGFRRGQNIIAERKDSGWDISKGQGINQRRTVRSDEPVKTEPNKEINDKQAEQEVNTGNMNGFQVVNYTPGAEKELYVAPFTQNSKFVREQSVFPERSTESEVPRETVHRGVLLAHGAAPYRFKPDMSKPESERDDNYFVKLQMENGKTRTLWGVGLRDAVQGLRQGEHVRFEDKGTRRVNWTETRKDGSTVEKSGARRIWAAEPTDWARQQERKAELNPDTDGPDVS